MDSHDSADSAREFGRLSLWKDSSRLAKDTAREHAARLELRAGADSETAVREEYLRLLGVKAGERVLDVGCGSGAVTRVLAQQVAPGGRAVGIDASTELLEVARELGNSAGLAETVEFREADCRNLPFADGAFNAVIAATTLCHVPQPLQALAEMVRVTRPGGRVGVFDLDGDMYLLSHPDRELTRKIVAFYSDQAWVNSWLMRELPARFAALGLVDVKIRGFMPVETGGYYANRAERCAESAAKHGVITNEQRDDWLAKLKAEIAASRFVGGQVHLFAWGRRADGAR